MRWRTMPARSAVVRREPLPSLARRASVVKVTRRTRAGRDRALIRRGSAHTGKQSEVLARDFVVSAAKLQKVISGLHRVFQHKEEVSAVRLAGDDLANLGE